MHKRSRHLHRRQQRDANVVIHKVDLTPATSSFFKRVSPGGSICGCIRINAHDLDSKSSTTVLQLSTLVGHDDDPNAALAGGRGLL